MRHNVLFDRWITWVYVMALMIGCIWHGLDALQGTRAKPGNHLVAYKAVYLLHCIVTAPLSFPPKSSWIDSWILHAPVRSHARTPVCVYNILNRHVEEKLLEIVSSSSIALLTLSPERPDHFALGERRCDDPWTPPAIYCRASVTLYCAPVWQCESSGQPTMTGSIAMLCAEKKPN